MDRLKIKKILRWVGGVLLALFSAGMLLSFLVTVTARDMFGQPMYDFQTADVFFFWLVILGAGAPAVLLLRRAILGVRPKQDEAAEDMEEDNAEDDEGNNDNDTGDGIEEAVEDNVTDEE